MSGFKIFESNVTEYDAIADVVRQMSEMTGGPMPSHARLDHLQSQIDRLAGSQNIVLKRVGPNDLQLGPASLAGFIMLGYATGALSKEMLPDWRLIEDHNRLRRMSEQFHDSRAKQLGLLSRLRALVAAHTVTECENDEGDDTGGCGHWHECSLLVDLTQIVQENP